MITYTRYFCLLVFPAVLFIGCSQDSSSHFGQGPQDQPGRPLFPMAIGNSWTYSFTTYDSLGAVLNTSNTTLNIPRDTIVAGETWYFYAAHGTIFWTTRTNGIWRWPIVAGQSSTPYLYLKYPAAAGDTVIDSSAAPARTITATLSLDSIIVTPSGTYHCIVYLLSNYDSNGALRSLEYAYYTLGIGWVASDRYAVNPWLYKKARIELVSYLIN